MPVQSKIIAGRAKKPPPVPAPKPSKPILKHPGTPRASPERPSVLRLPNGPYHSPQHVQNVQKVEFSFPEENKDKVNKDENEQSADRTGALYKRIKAEHMDQYGAMSEDTAKADSKGSNTESGDNSKTDEQGSQPHTPRAKYSRAQFRHSIGGDWALKECEELTDWANHVLKTRNLPLVTDLRKSVGDGFTLPTVLEIVSGVGLKCVKVSPQTKEDRVENLRKCLTFLAKRGCDVTLATPSELEDGNLRSSLVLLGNIRKHFQKSYTPTVNGHTEDVSPARESPPPPLPSRRMPGAVKQLPGAVPTPFLTGRDSSPIRGKTVPSSPNRKASLRDDELIPGSLHKEPHSDHSRTHSVLISTTELGTNGVSQHGVEERRQHITSSSHNARGVLLRSTTGKPAQTPPPHNTGAPQGVTRAWTASPRPQANNTNINGSSVEDRLRQLFDGNSQTKDSALNDKQGFHGGGSEVFDDGELLVVPPPHSRNSSDFDMMMLDNHGYGPGYRHPTNQHRGQRSNQGYVPSKPADRWQGPRAEVILSRKPEPSPTLVRARTQPAPQMVPGMTRGHDNQGYTQDSSGQVLRSRNNTPDQDYLRTKPPSPRKSGGHDLRSAWNKLYGANSQPPQRTSPSQSPQGVSNNSLNRGDNTRTSYGPHSPSRNLHDTSQYSVQFAPNTPPQTSRPVSAPAPADMHVHFEKLGQSHIGQGQLGHDHIGQGPLGHGRSPSQERIDGQLQGQSGVMSSTLRTSPMGQSSSTQGQLDGSMSSQLTSGSHADPGQLNLSSSLDNTGKPGIQNTLKSSLSSPSSVNSPNSPGYTIGPAAKYPEIGSRPSSAKNRISGALTQGSPAVKHKDMKHVSDSHNSGNSPCAVKHKSANSPHRHKRFSEDLTKALKSASGRHHSQSFDYSFDDSRELNDQSIFDYDVPSRSETSGSVTPPLPPLSPTVTPPDSPDLSPTLPRSHSATNISNAKMHETMLGLGVSDKRRTRRTSELQFKMERKHNHGKRRNPAMKSKGANLRDVREDLDIESNLSIDIDDTILTIDSHDTEQHPAGEILTSTEAAALRQQLQKLETMYSELQQKVEPEKDPQGPRQPPPIGRQRRWSIGSSDTSSFRREAKYKPGKHIHHRHHSKEFKNINKRFQRLESHVVTLARSVAHLSSELRTHNAMVHDLDTVKRELREFKDNPGLPFPRMPGAESLERFRNWAPSVTNTKRVNKLTKFFGAEPPLLELFLKKLGYEKYISNFKSEHIGMMELPYMSEERLEKIGIPMGPRIRILEESQMCFRQENFNVYIV